MLNFTLTKIINIREMYFQVGLSKADGGEFLRRIRGVLMGQNLNVNVNFNTLNIWPLIRKLAEMAVIGLSGFIG